MTQEFPWSPRRASGAVNLQEWMSGIELAITKLLSPSKGLGSTAWRDEDPDGAWWDPTKFRAVPSYTPGWRQLQDSRIELRGQLERGSYDTNGVFIPAPVTNGEVLVQLPYVCSPPTNEQIITTVMAQALCTAGGDNPGVFRVDIQRGPDWVVEVVVKKDEDGNPVLDENGDPVPILDENGDPTTVNMSKVNVIARPPQNKPINGWISLEGVIYDPNLYIDVLAPVPVGQEPLVARPGWAIKQHPDGRVEWFTPGINYSST